MRTSELHYTYPLELVATAPHEPCRIALQFGQQAPREISWPELYALFRPGDVLVRNETKVAKRRVFSLSGLEILFAKQLAADQWEVLFPARENKIGDHIALPGGMNLELLQKGLPQQVRTSELLSENYFEQYGELALPPYIQKARGERHMQAQDENWYQTEWAKNLGSSAAPTASLHFHEKDFAQLRSQGVQICELTLHVGLGTFLPVKSELLTEHKMHSEPVTIPRATREALHVAKQSGGRIWALGTTVARSLEAMARGDLQITADGAAEGETQIFIYPGFKWQIVDGLLTNFHQPQSTLLAMIAAFAGLPQTFATYHFAIAQRMRLFSYGDLSVWIKK